MNILIDELPYAVTIAGQLIPINTDYRTGVLFEQLMGDPTIPDEEKLYDVLELYYGEGLALFAADPAAVVEAVNMIRWFYRCGADEDTRVDSDPGETDTGRDPPFSYEYDAGYIYSAFVEAYHIDLTEKRLHWWQFRALFLALPETTQFQKIVGYRTMTIPAKMPKDQKRFYQKMKKQFKIPEPPDRVRLEKDLEAILSTGGDISQLVK